MVINIDDIPKRIINNPYSSICDWAENRFKKVGEKVFEFLSLMPISLIAPKIPYEDTFIAPNINFMLLTPSGGCKTAIAQAFSQITYNPFDFESITPAALQSELRGKANRASLITGDMARILKDPVLIKVLEGILGDGKVSRMTMRADERFDVNAIAYLAGVPSDISSYLSSGLIFRVAPQVIMHPPRVQWEIGKEIVDSIGKQSSDVDINSISKYYELIDNAINGRLNDKKYQITGYKFDEVYKQTIWKQWAKKLIEFRTRESTNWYRELFGGFKYLCCSAVLNLFNREIDKGIIYPTEYDLKIAAFLMDREIRTKNHLVNCESFARNFRKITDLEKVVQKHDDKIDDFSLELVKNIIDNK